MDNTLSELSKPVAWIIGEESIEEFKRGYETFVVRGDDVDSTEETMKLYSQEYVSALQHESAVNCEAAASLNVENQELKKRIAELEARLSEMTTFRDNAVKKNERRWEELLELRTKLAKAIIKEPEEIVPIIEFRQIYVISEIAPIVTVTFPSNDSVYYAIKLPPI